MDLHLTKLKLTQFKNYESEVLTFSERLNCFVGQNGAGKTNLLDAIYYLCMCKSYFSIPDSSISKHGESIFRLEGDFKREDTPEKIVAKVRVRKKKEIERNKVVYKRLSEHIGLLPIVMIAPDDTQLATEGSEARRKFLDNTLSQLDPSYLKHLILYNKLLERRNATLKKFFQTGLFDNTLLETYSQQMAAPAAYIHQKRKETVELFLPIFEDIYGAISNEKEAVNCTYQSKLNTASLLELFEENREKDRILQRTTAGIHKDDLVFSINEHSVKRFASQGQLKSFVLAVKLGQYELIRAHKQLNPILLLDDIFDKLDVTRVRSLLNLLLDKKYGQIFITDTHEDRVEEIVSAYSADYKKYLVSNGSVKEEVRTSD